MQIDKAIQENDQREYVRDFSRHENETPLRQHCQIINTESLEDALRLQDNSNSFPAIAVLSRPGLNPSNTPDISYIDQRDCSYEGVRTTQAELRSAVRQYHRAFLELDRLRESYANTHDIFGTELSKYVCPDNSNNLSTADLGLTQRTYYHLKKNVEDRIHSFLRQITEVLSNIVRLQRIATARRMGWGYLINHPNANFLVLVRHPSLLYTVGSNLNLLDIPESWNMDRPSNVPNRAPDFPNNDKREEQKKRSYNNDYNMLNNTYNNVDKIADKYFQPYLSPFMSKCVTSVGSLSEMSSQILKGQNQTFQIIALTEKNVLLNQKLEDAKKVFYLWHNTARGWFTSSYWAQKLNTIEKEFLEYILLIPNTKCSKINLKMDLLNNIIKIVQRSLNQQLHWYYDPEYVYTMFKNEIQGYGKAAIKKC
jgi:hypothetical protein